MEAAKATLYAGIARQVRQARVDGEQGRGHRLDRIVQALVLSAALAAPSYALAVGYEEAAAAKQLAALVNSARSGPRQCGNAFFGPSPPLKWNDILAGVAVAHTEDMAQQNRMSHGSLEGPAERVQRAGYNYRSIAENVAAGQRTPQETMAQWLASPQHCANLMDPAYVETGAAIAFNADRTGTYWAQMFGTRMR